MTEPCHAQEVTLHWYEAAMAVNVGWMRQFKAMTAGKHDCHGYAGDGWSEHIEGACGEMAVAKSLGIFWDGSVNTWKAADLAGMQIRTRSRHEWELIVRPGDDDKAAWVLVTGRCPHYVVRGWIAGADAKRADWLQNHGNRPPAYFVPQHALRPMEELYGR